MLRPDTGAPGSSAREAQEEDSLHAILRPSSHGRVPPLDAAAWRGDEARGLGSPGEEGRARFDSAKQSRFIQSRQWAARRQKPIESQLKANRKSISHAAKRDQAAGRVAGEAALRALGAELRAG